MYTVLVAEDEPLALKNICSIVEKYCPEYRVIATARDGASALEKIRQVRPDVVVSDIKMPRPTFGRDGLPSQAHHAQRLKAISGISLRASPAGLLSGAKPDSANVGTERKCGAGRFTAVSAR